MRLVALCSGGKDSTLALHLALQEGHEVLKIVSMVPSRSDSWMYHWPNIELMDLFAEAVGIEATKVRTSGEPDREVGDLKSALSELDIDGVVSGAVASTYQKSRIDRVCRELGLRSVAPLWGRNPAEVIKENLDSGFEIIITAVAAEGFNGSWLGRRLDENCYRELLELHERYGINPVGEGGEYETFVTDGPIFKSRVEILEAEKEWNGTRGYYLIKRAVLKGKT